MINFSEEFQGFSGDMLINSLKIKSPKQLYKVLMYAFYQGGKDELNEFYAVNS